MPVQRVNRCLGVDGEHYIVVSPGLQPIQSMVSLAGLACTDLLPDYFNSVPEPADNAAVSFFQQTFVQFPTDGGAGLEHILFPVADRLYDCETY